MALELLNASLSDARAFEVLARSIAAAHKCEQAIDRKSLHRGRVQIDIQAAAAFGRVAKCIKRAPGKLRQRVDHAVASVRWHEPVDAEVINGLLEVTIVAFSAYPACEPVTTALDALTSLEDFGVRRRRQDYLALSWPARASVEAALSALRSKGTPKADSVFATMASAIQAGGFHPVDRAVHSQIIEYVAEVAEIWRDAGLRPGRANYSSDLSRERYAICTSKFHRFVALVLGAITGLQVVDDQLKKGLRIQKTGSNTP